MERPVYSIRSAHKQSIRRIIQETGFNLNDFTFKEGEQSFTVIYRDDLEFTFYVHGSDYNLFVHEYMRYSPDRLLIGFKTKYVAFDVMIGNFQGWLNHSVKLAHEDSEVEITWKQSQGFFQDVEEDDLAEGERRQLIYRVDRLKESIPALFREYVEKVILDDRQSSYFKMIEQRQEELTREIEGLKALINEPNAKKSTIRKFLISMIVEYAFELGLEWSIGRAIKYCLNFVTSVTLEIPNPPPMGI